MRKILRQNFWSHGTYLGSLGPLSQKGQDGIFSKQLFPFILDLNMCPALVSPFVIEKNLDTLPT